MGRAALYPLKGKAVAAMAAAVLMRHSQSSSVSVWLSAWLPCGRWKQGPAKRRLPQSRLAVPSSDARSSHVGAPSLELSR